jgi:hypothetical protein
MALVACGECGAKVSPEALACPHCGALLAKKSWVGYGFEWKSGRTCCGYPLVHVALGRDSLGRLRVAKGVIAIGQFAVGLITVAQFGVGVVFGFGQFILGFTALAQFAFAALLGVGQIATGYAAVGQIVLAYYGLGQIGLGEFLWSMHRRDPEAVQFFQGLWNSLRHFFYP